MEFPEIPNMDAISEDIARAKWEMAEASGEITVKALKPLLEQQNQLLASIQSSLQSIEAHILNK